MPGGKSNINIKLQGLGVVKNTFLEVNRQLQIEDLTRNLSRARPRPRTRENHRPLEMQITPGDHRAPFVLRGWNVPPGRVGVGVGEREPLCPQGKERGRPETQGSVQES